MIKKPSEDIPENALITVEESEALHYVGRGALKLRAALNSFGIDPGGMTAVDIGASTGGFTQCLLEGGAVKVFALDSGHGQLSPLLTGDGRVVSIEGFNARYLTEAVIGCRCDIAVMDVSFISQRLLYSAVSSVLKDDGIFISLIKPQFEAGRCLLYTSPVLYAGGVMSCAYIKERLGSRFDAYFAPPELSSDNAAGAAILCRKKYLSENGVI